jgi:penicillin-binding protein 2
MDQFASRRNIIAGIILLASLSLVIRLFYLQVIDTSYKLSAENNSKRIEILYPARGLILDRNKKLLVYNQPAYDLMIAPYEMKAFDTLELSGILGMDMQKMRAGIKKAFGPKFRREPFVKQLSPENYARLQEKLYKFPGFYVRSRTLRRYNKEFAAHLFGYVGEVDEKIMASNNIYALGDYIGISGIEGYYEKFLKGHKGQEVLLVDVHGRVKGPYQGGRFDEDAIVGRNLVSTIDGDLQEYGEKLMRNFKGSIVAIEPSTGEILTMISAPSYNPSLLVGRQRTANYAKLQADPQMPLFNRALMANYPPGSTFKPFEALVGLQEGVITAASTFSCNQGFFGRGISMGCHVHPSPLDLEHGIANSCNAYFCNVFLRIIENPKYKNVELAYRVWRDYALAFGFGNRLNSDVNNELKGFIAPVSYYDKYYGANHWNAVTINSLSIGQGEILLTPLQMANMAATIANRGYYITPHVIKQIEGIDTIESRFYKKHVTPIDTQYYGTVVRGMELSVIGGTSVIARLPNIVVCGKTGTAQNPHGQPHSVFIAFAPKNNPKIAILVFVENGHFGATFAAPIASLMIEKYLTDSISPARKYIEERMLNSNLLYNNDR